MAIKKNGLQSSKKHKQNLILFFMFLDKVGGRGMNLKLIKRLGKQLAYQHKRFMSTRVVIKAQGQIEQLKSLGVKGCYIVNIDSQ